ncbi:hypothetical protein CEXT_335021 [Caerostris extrusa]|uniref:Uncharacterized protein n=1 Tax=Caerostris extrusa TaxID=172846 RepID=A0AAV4NB85_CAEEX|nr:hypothetical protein CEXT_335021 [Caerostris extrusa]
MLTIWQKVVDLCVDANRMGNSSRLMRLCGGISALNLSSTTNLLGLELGKARFQMNRLCEEDFKISGVTNWELPPNGDWDERKFWGRPYPPGVIVSKEEER